MPSITIDGRICEVARGTTILETARDEGARIPTLCYLKDVSAIGSCRLCVVDVDGEDTPVPACTTVVRDGMVVVTDSPRLSSYRRVALELLVASCVTCSAGDCRACDSDGDCELQTLCLEYGVFSPDATATTATPTAAQVTAAATQVAGAVPDRFGNPFLTYDETRCIECQRCVAACNSVAGNHSLYARQRGVRTIIVTPFGDDWRETGCESCGTCAQVCPTGALATRQQRNYRAREVQRVRTTCPHCGVGCQLDLVVRDGHIVSAEGAPGPSNHSLLCVKGRFASFPFVDAPDRLTTPLIKNPATGQFETATWDEALDEVATRFTELRETYQGSSLAAFGCSRATNEDLYMFQKMARTVFATNNVDCCARV